MTHLLARSIRGAYTQFRGKPLADDVPLAVLLEEVRVRAVQLVRGYLRSRRYGQCGPWHFRGRQAVVRAPRWLRVGTGVVIGDGVVIEAFAKQGVALGDRVTVARGAAILGSGVIAEPGVGVLVGNHTAIGANNVVWGQGGVRIGADCLLGPGVTIVSENHSFTDLDVPIRSIPGERAAVEIGDDCWIGAGAKVLAGVTIGHGTVVGAGSVVTRSLPPLSIAVGVPARVIGSRQHRGAQQGG